MTTRTRKASKRVLTEARKLGRQAAENAAAWWEQDAIGGRSSASEADIARTLMAIQDGAMDLYGGPNLSGEWADGPTPASLAEELGIDPDDAESVDAVCEAWEEGASDYVAFCERECIRALGGWKRAQRVIAKLGRAQQEGGL